MTGKKRKGNSRTSAFITAIFVAAALSAALGLSFSPAGAGAIYSYKDCDGVIHFTDAPTDSRYKPFMIFGGARGERLYKIHYASIQNHIKEAARIYDLEPALIHAVIKAESAYDPAAVSIAGAQGLMQLMPDTAENMKVQDTFDPRDNIFGGTRYLRYLLNRFQGDLKLALAAYNLGPEKIRLGQEIPPVQETRTYVKRVMQYYQEFKKSDQ